MKRSIEDLIESVRLRDEAINRLAAEQRPSYRFRDRDPNSGPLLVSMDPHKPGRWRVTHFLADMRPRGHVEAATLREALREASAFGAVLEAE